MPVDGGVGLDDKKALHLGGLRGGNDNSRTVVSPGPGQVLVTQVCTSHSLFHLGGLQAISPDPRWTQCRGCWVGV